MYHVPEPGNGIHAFLTIRVLPGHKDFYTALIYMHILKKGGRAVKSHAG
jgi:hypothetical protein